MKRLFTFVLATAMAMSISMVTSATETSIEPIQEPLQICEVHKNYTPINPGPVVAPESTEQSPLRTACSNCGAPSMIAARGDKYEPASCGHWAYWDGLYCGRCGDSIVYDVYLKCSC